MARFMQQLLNRLLRLGIGTFSEVAGADAAVMVDEVTAGQ
jgi:hypothetical protein